MYGDQFTVELRRLGSGGASNGQVPMFQTATGTYVPASPGSSGLGDMILASVQTNTGAKTFNSSTLLVRNPGNTFSYTIVASAIAAARTLTLPLTTVDDTFAVLAKNQTFTGIETFSGKVVLNGGVAPKRTATAISYTALTTDIFVGVTDTSAARTITLPLAANGLILIIKDESGGAATNNITIQPDASLPDVIDGAASKTINTNYGVIRMYAVSGTGWYTF
jgi:hypothetical protein